VVYEKKISNDTRKVGGCNHHRYRLRTIELEVVKMTKVKSNGQIYTINPVKGYVQWTARIIKGSLIATQKDV